MKLAVVGSRSFNNYEILERIINKIVASKTNHHMLS